MKIVIKFIIKLPFSYYKHNINKEISVHYNALLAEVGGLDPDTEASQGFAPAEIIEKVKQFDLDMHLLNVTLRGYQAFGAKYALVQKHTILGDEIGLGKTIEALAVLCHLKRQGGTHFLVVCPASVLVNWEHEIIRHSYLEHPWRLHGPERIQRLGVWAEQGGLAITTFDTLKLLDLKYDLTISAMIVDEAHFVKNPRALRSLFKTPIGPLCGGIKYFGVKRFS